ncbi:hypothetical protein YH65_06250 [Sulfurovum lithotrophicum]|uniref:Uncharacterized protein n=1 Tax=Sulfurovum lithotrophicum TaxID=206403 RepID=A0A7U4M1B4_9BACT|nr:hypothetical protein [Sulfurovum lithotrophicum]AKF25038.1 hypothetical protein YH65_06250 [Sulfurovum lithotrophicum]
MFKKLVTGISVVGILATHSMAFSIVDDNTCTDSTINVAEIIASSSSLDNSTAMSASLLETSKNLLKLSESLLNAGDNANKDYVNAMLQLSQDIGTMADRIGEMADRILIMADNIDAMADKILETQRIQNNNVSLTQENILAAQVNFNTLLNL